MKTTIFKYGSGNFNKSFNSIFQKLLEYYIVLRTKLSLDKIARDLHQILFKTSSNMKQTVSGKINKQNHELYCVYAISA